MHTKDTLDASETHPLVDSIQNLGTGRLTMSNQFGLGVEAATTDLAQIRLSTVFRLPILDGLNALTGWTLGHPTITSRLDSHYQILEVLGKVEAGQRIEDVARSSGVAKATIHRRQAKYGAMTRDDTKRLRQLEEENNRLKKLVADLALDNSILKEVVAKKW